MTKKVIILLKDRLEERGMTQSKLAEAADVRPSAVSALARGYIDRLSIEHIEKIGTILECKLSDLIKFEDD